MFLPVHNLSVPNLNEGSPIQIGPYRSQSIIPVIMTQPVIGFSHNFVPGEWGGTGIAHRLGNSGNVVADLTRRKDDISRDTHLTGNIYLDIMILEGLNFRSTLGGTWDKGFIKDNTYATYERSENIVTNSLEETDSITATGYGPTRSLLTGSSASIRYLQLPGMKL